MLTAPFALFGYVTHRFYQTGVFFEFDSTFRGVVLFINHKAPATIDEPAPMSFRINFLRVISILRKFPYCNRGSGQTLIDSSESYIRCVR